MSDYKTFFDISHDVFCILGPDWHYTHVNTAFLNLLKSSEDEVIGRHFTDFIHSEDRVATEKAYLAATNNNLHYLIENRFRSADGGFHWILWSTIVADESGYLYVAGQVTTRLKHLTAELGKQQEITKMKVLRAIVSTQESERAKLSQELHDNINQVLTTVKLFIELCIEDQSVSIATLPKAAMFQQQAINEIRSLSKALSAPLLRNISLADSVHQLLDVLTECNKLKITFAFNGINGLKMEEFIHLTLYRILQEHFTNIIKHANAKNANLAFELSDGILLMSLKDDGDGFDPEMKGKGLGIQNMNSRAESIGGTLTLHSSRGMGCTLTVTVPLKPARKAMVN